MIQVYGFAFVPRSIVKYQNISFSLKTDILICMIQEDLEDFRVRMAELERIELLGSRTDCSCNTHAKVSNFVGLAYLFSLLGTTQRGEVRIAQRIKKRLAIWKRCPVAKELIPSDKKS